MTIMKKYSVKLKSKTGANYSPPLSRNDNQRITWQCDKNKENIMSDKYFVQVLSTDKIWDDIDIIDDFGGQETYQQAMQYLVNIAQEYGKSHPTDACCYRIIDSDSKDEYSYQYFYNGKSIDEFTYEMRRKKWSDSSIVASGISGYEHGQTDSAQYDFYYDCENQESKKKAIFDYAIGIYEISLNDIEIHKVYEFLESHFSCENDRYYEFEKLIG